MRWYGVLAYVAVTYVISYLWQTGIAWWNYPFGMLVGILVEKTFRAKREQKLAQARVVRVEGVR